MQINIDKKTGTLLGVILVLILAVVFLLAGNSGQSMDHSGHGSSSKDDSTNAEVKSLSENIVKGQSAEIEAMKALLK